MYSCIHFVIACYHWQHVMFFHIVLILFLVKYINMLNLYVKF